MPLVDTDFSINDAEIPENVEEFLHDANSRVNQLVQDKPVQLTGFVPCNFETVYRALRAIAELNLSAGNLFCEWGSGYGVVALLAEMLGFKAYGIEIEDSLVDASRLLAVDFGLPVEFVHGSFVPAGAEDYLERSANNDETFWLVTDADDAYDDLGLDPDDFDLIFAYPWPGEEYVLENLFEKYAAEGALLLTYDQFDSVRLRRKVGKRRRS